MPLGPLLAGQLLRVNVWGFVGSWCILQGERVCVCHIQYVCVCVHFCRCFCSWQLECCCESWLIMNVCRTSIFNYHCVHGKQASKLICPAQNESKSVVWCFA